MTVFFLSLVAILDVFALGAFWENIYLFTLAYPGMIGNEISLLTYLEAH